jgi:predicted aconitase with swiveling domain
MPRRTALSSSNAFPDTRGRIVRSLMLLEIARETRIDIGIVHRKRDAEFGC